MTLQSPRGVTFSKNAISTQPDQADPKMECELKPVPSGLDLVLLKEDPLEENPNLMMTRSKVVISKNGANVDHTNSLLNDILPVIAEYEGIR